MDDVTDIQTLMDYKNAKLTSGRMPEKPGEIVVDMKLWNNKGNACLEAMSANYTIVGQLESEFYLAMGLALPAENDVNVAVFHPDDGKDYGKLIEDAGIKLLYVSDYQTHLFHYNYFFFGVFQFVPLSRNSLFRYVLFYRKDYDIITNG